MPPVFLQSPGGLVNTAVEGFMEEKERGVAKYMENFVTEFNPALLRDLARATDDTKRMAVYAADRAASPVQAEIQYMKDPWKRNTPGYSKDLPAELDPITGRPHMDVTPWRLLNPTKETEYNGDVVLDEIAKQQVRFSRARPSEGRLPQASPGWEPVPGA